MATRTIPSAAQRLVTILVAPLMTCSARLPVYALLIGAFVPARKVLGPIGLQGLVLLGLYVLGALAALGAAAMLRRTLVLRGRAAVLPRAAAVSHADREARDLAGVGRRARASCAARARSSSRSRSCCGRCSRSRASRRPCSSTPRKRGRYALEHSFAGRIGHAIEPAIAPLGFDWKIGVGLVASLAAREVIVSTLAQIYAASGDDEGSLRDCARERSRPRDRRADLHAGDGRGAARVLRVRAAVHLDDRHARDARRIRGAGPRSRSRTCWPSPTARASWHIES